MSTIPPQTNDPDLSEALNYEPPLPPSRQIASTSAVAGEPALETILRSYAVLVGRTLGLLTRSSAQAYDDFCRYARVGYARTTHEASDLARQAQERAKYVKQQYPLEAIGVLAGTAFLAGIGLRVWRSRSS